MEDFKPVTKKQLQALKRARAISKKTGVYVPRKTQKWNQQLTKEFFIDNF